MNWTTFILTALGAAVEAVVLALKPKPPTLPAPAARAPGFAAIDAAEDERLMRERVPPPVVPTRPATESAVDRAEDAGAMVDSEQAPTVRRPEP